MYWKYFCYYYNRNFSKLILLIFSTISISLTLNTITVKAADFNDVPRDHWAYNSINQLRDLKITDGIGNGRFGLGNYIKRSEFTAFLVKLMGFTEATTEPSFSDNSDKNKWYYNAIEIAVKNGVVIKDSAYFRPEDPITREDMAIMIIRALGYEELSKQLTDIETPFDDIEKNKEYIAMAYDFGIVAGMGNNKFNPQNLATREQAAVMMINMYKRKNSRIKDLHAFYAIRSSNQIQYINDLTSVSFGWARLELNENDIILNTSKTNNNEYNVPEGFTEPIELAKNNNIPSQLLITVKGEYTSDNMSLTDYIVSSQSPHA